MADLALVTANKVNVGTITFIQHSGVAGVDITAGAPVYLDATTGKYLLGDANLAGANVGAFGVSTLTVKAGQPLTVVCRGYMDGWDLSGMAYGDAVYVSDTGGRLADAPGTATLRVGIVVPNFGVAPGTTPDKILLVDCPMTGV